jgi:hypothetical protein
MILLEVNQVRFLISFYGFFKVEFTFIRSCWINKLIVYDLHVTTCPKRQDGVIVPQDSPGNKFLLNAIPDTIGH